MLALIIALLTNPSLACGAKYFSSYTVQEGAGAPVNQRNDSYMAQAYCNSKCGQLAIMEGFSKSVTSKQQKLVTVRDATGYTSKQTQTFTTYSVTASCTSPQDKMDQATQKTALAEDMGRGGVILTGAPVITNADATAGSKDCDPKQRNSCGVYVQADKASKKAGAGQMLGLVAAGISGAVAMKTCPGCAAAGGCTMCYIAVGGVAVSVLTSLNMQKAKDEAAKTRDLAMGLPVLDTAAASDPWKKLTSSPNFAPVASSMDTLKKSGFKVDLKNGKFTSPNGKSYSAEDFKSAASMKAAGFNEDAISKFADLMKQASTEAQAKVQASGEELSGGGASAGSGNAALPMPDIPSFELPKDPAASREPAAVAGMTKMFNGEPIGVSVDSIFLMMNRRYNLKGQQDNFIVEH